MKTEEIIELAKKAGFTYTDIKLTAIGHRIETFAALHRKALIESGELVPREKADALQAQIDSLMLEYCPEEMTAEQLENWRKAQQPADLLKD